MSLGDRLRRALGDHRVPLVVAAMAVVLSTPSLWLGLQVDDYILRLMLIKPSPDPSWSRLPVDVFTFFSGDEESTRELLEAAETPWWTHPRIRLAFFRPITSLTHWVDFRLWPDRPWLMHVQSLLWFGGAIAAAALLYRRLLVPSWAAGLAALLFAVDDAHGLPAVWIANRNASIGVLFGLLALIAHDRWRRDGWRPGVVIAPLAFLVGLLAGEIALAAAGFLLAYALFIDTGPWPRRLATLVPAGAVAAAWWATYRVLGYGARGSWVYIDPGAQPIAFAHALVERAPLLLSGLWGLPSNLSQMLSVRASQVLWWIAVGIVLAIAALLLHVLRRDRVAQFFALGMVLSIVPACATFPNDRLLFFAGFGGMGLLAQLLAAVWQQADWLPRTRIRRLPFRAACWVLMAIHLVLAPVGLFAASASLRTIGTFVERAGGSLPSGPSVIDKTAVIVATPSTWISTYGPLIQALRGRQVANRTLILGSSIYPITVTRIGENEIALRPDGGFLAVPGSPRPGDEATQPTFDPRFFFQMTDRLYRDATPMSVGERIAYGGATVEILDVTEDGRPAEVSFRFDVDLENPSLVWLRWNNGAYVPFTPPAVGGSTVVQSVSVPF